MQAAMEGVSGGWGTGGGDGLFLPPAARTPSPSYIGVSRPNRLIEFAQEQTQILKQLGERITAHAEGGAQEARTPYSNKILEVAAELLGSVKEARDCNVLRIDFENARIESERRGLLVEANEFLVGLGVKFTNC